MDYRQFHFIAEVNRCGVQLGTTDNEYALRSQRFGVPYGFFNRIDCMKPIAHLIGPVTGDHDVGTPHQRAWQ